MNLGKFKKLICLVLAALIPLSSSASYYKDGEFEWTSRDDNGDEWHAYAYNLEWNFKDYTLTVRKRPGDYGNYWYKDEDGTYGSSYKDEMLDYFGRFTINGWSDNGLLIHEVFQWVDFSLSLASLVGSFTIAALKPVPLIKPAANLPRAGQVGIIAGEYWYKTGKTIGRFLIKSPHVIPSKTGSVSIRISHTTAKLIQITSNFMSKFVKASSMWSLANAGYMSGMSLATEGLSRVLIDDQNISASAATGGGSIYGDANSGYWLHYFKSPWSLMGLTDEIKKVVIEEGVVVGTLAFGELPNLRVVHAKRGAKLKPLSFYECESLSYVFIDDNYNESWCAGSFPVSKPRKTTYVVDGEMKYYNTTTFSLGASPWQVPSMPYFDRCGLYANSFHIGKSIENDRTVGEEYRQFLIQKDDYAIPLGIKTPKKDYIITRLRSGNVDVAYEFKEGTENKPLMPNKEINTSKTANFINYKFDGVVIMDSITEEKIYTSFESKHLLIDYNKTLSVKDGGYPDGKPFEILVYQEELSVITVEGEETKEDIGLMEDEEIALKVFDDYGFHTVIDVTAYDDDSYRENNIPTGTIEEDLYMDDNIFKIHNLNANGKTVITTAAQQDSLHKYQTNKYDTITIYADVNRNTPTYILNFTSKATNLSVNGQSRYYIDGKLSERQYGKDVVIRPKSIWSDEDGVLKYAKEGEVYYDDVLVGANWGVSWKYIIKTVMYSKKKNLDTLSVDGLHLYPSFHKDVYEYDVYSDKDSLKELIINAAISNPWSANIAHNIDGDRYEVSVHNKITGESSTYTIKLNRTTPRLSNLLVDGTPVDLIKNKLVYEIKVDELDINTQVVFEPVENCKVIDNGWDYTEIQSGKMTYIITVQTPTHEQATYKIVLFKDISVEDEEVVDEEVVDKEVVEEERVLKYSLQTSGDPYVGRKYNVTVTPQDNDVTVSGNESKTLKYGLNNFKITLKKGDVTESVDKDIKANYSSYNGNKMSRFTNPDSTTTVKLKGKIQNAGDWDTEYFDLTKKLIIECGGFAINTQIPQCAAEIVDLKNAYELPDDFLGNCRALKELHLYQSPWTINDGVFSEPAKMTIRTNGKYVNKYKSYPVWCKIREILPFEGEVVPEVEVPEPEPEEEEPEEEIYTDTFTEGVNTTETNIDQVEAQDDETLNIYNVYGEYLGTTERSNRKIVIPSWLGHGVFVAKGSKYVEKFVN